MPINACRPESTRPFLPINGHDFLLRLAAKATDVDTFQYYFLDLAAPLTREASFQHLDVITLNVKPVELAVGA